MVLPIGFIGVLAAALLTGQLLQVLLLGCAHGIQKRTCALLGHLYLL